MEEGEGSGEVEGNKGKPRGKREHLRALETVATEYPRGAMKLTAPLVGKPSLGVSRESGSHSKQQGVPGRGSDSNVEKPESMRGESHPSQLPWFDEVPVGVPLVGKVSASLTQRQTRKRVEPAGEGELAVTSRSRR